MSNTKFGEFLRSKKLEFSQPLEYLMWYEKTRDNYDDFLQQPLTLGMFLLCDLEGNVLQEPKCDCYTEYDREGCPDKCWRFINSKECVLFKKVKLTEDKYKDTKRKFWYIDKLRIAHELKFYSGENQFTFDVLREHETIEDLVKYNLELTDSAIKQLGI